MRDDDTKKKKMLTALADATERIRDQHREGCHIRAVADQLSGLYRAAATGSGPAQVATADYRASWERTFSGKKPVVGQA